MRGSLRGGVSRQHCGHLLMKSLICRKTQLEVRGEGVLVRPILLAILPQSGAKWVGLLLPTLYTREAKKVNSA